MTDMRRLLAFNIGLLGKESALNTEETQAPWANDPSYLSSTALDRKRMKAEQAARAAKTPGVEYTEAPTIGGNAPELIKGAPVRSASPAYPAWEKSLKLDDRGKTQLKGSMGTYDVNRLTMPPKDALKGIPVEDASMIEDGINEGRFQSNAAKMKDFIKAMA